MQIEFGSPLAIIHICFHRATKLNTFIVVEVIFLSLGSSSAEAKPFNEREKRQPLQIGLLLHCNNSLPLTHLLSVNEYTATSKPTIDGNNLINEKRSAFMKCKFIDDCQQQTLFSSACFFIRFHLSTMKHSKRCIPF